MSKLIFTSFAALSLLALAGCGQNQTDTPVTVVTPPASKSTTTATIPAQDTFLSELRMHCGKTYGGKLVSTDPQDSDMAGEAMTITVNCAKNGVRIPFAVGDNRSRTWVISKTDTGLRLKHQHNHKDGSEDKLSQYGGDTAAKGTGTRQEFPADGYSIALFLQQGLDVSIDNVWAVEITPTIYAYELRRPNRHFRVEFDVTKPLASPFVPW